MELSEIRQKLKIGDRSTIAESLGCSKSYVERVVRGERNIEASIARKIIDFASQLIEARENVKNHFGESQKTA